MTKVILNDMCAHCKHKECHDGENFCRQAMKENSFYKNAKLYKGLKVIPLPTYEDLEKENAELEIQIEKMKNYLNCENFGTEKCGKSADGCVCKNWELIK